MKKVISVLAALVIGFTALAQITLPAVIGDHMVLQRNSVVNLWGKAGPGAPVHIKTSWNQKSYSCKADKEGAWAIGIETPDAGGPYQITLKEKNRMVLNDIMIGEVWIASGQSNMEMPVTGFMGQPVENALATISEASEYPGIRMFTVTRHATGTPQEECQGGWKCSNAQSVGEFSATAYFFARQLNRILNIPVGVIASHWGGSAIEAWMPEKTLETIAGLDLKTAKSGEYDHSKPGLLYNGMIHPIIHYTARGFIWYQGESNLHNYYDYDKLMVALVKQWRNDWKDQEMPFYYVQLAPYNYEGAEKIALPLQVEMQYKALEQLSHAGIAATNDIGHPTCIHPPKKNEVGQRLAFLALEETYGIKGFPAFAPTLKEVTYADAKAILTFNHLAAENQFNDMNSFDYYNGKIEGFEIAGEDRKFYKATARHLWWKNQIELQSTEVPNPVAVRYGFRNVPAANVRTTMGLPLVPFRTDHWDDVW
jgi:sialate O-acetylesterase